MFKYFVYFISLRYIKTRLITLFSIAGVAVGVMVLLVVLSVMDGFKTEFKSRLQGTLSDVIVTVRNPNATYPDLKRKISKHPLIKACAPHLHGLVLIGTGRFYAGGMVVGIDYSEEIQVGKLRSYMVTAYKLEKLIAEDILEKNVKHFITTLYSWEVIGGEFTPAQGVFPAGMTITCKKTIIKKPKASKTRQGELSVYEAYTFSNTDPPKIIFIERDIEEVIALKAPALEGAEKVRYKAFFANMEKSFTNRDLPGFIGHYSEDLQTYPEQLDKDNPFKLPPNNNIKNPDEPDRPLILGYELMRQLNLKRGSEIGIMTGKRDPIKGELKPVSRKFTVVGAFRSGWQEIDARFCYAQRKDLAGFIDWKSDVTEVCISLKDPQATDIVKQDLESVLNQGVLGTQFIIEKWEDRRRTLLAAIQLERNVMTFILYLIILLAVVSIMIILILLVTEKTKDIGILKSMGATNEGIMGIFLFNGFFISVCGAIIGCILGVLISLNVNTIADWIFELSGFRVFPRDVYYLDQIPVELNLSNVLGIVLPTLLLALGACTIPARNAANLDPVRALSSEYYSRKKLKKSRQEAKADPLARVKGGFFATENLSGQYVLGSQKIPVFQDINLDITRGEVLVILGTSGAGKSTLLHILGMLDTPHTGAVYHEGINLNTLSSKRKCKIRNRNIGFIFQFYHLLAEFTALENVILASMVDHNIYSWHNVKDEKIKRAKELLTRVGLEDRMEHRPLQLSGGERQRVAIARALVNDPQIVLCDEPTGNLDEENSKSIQNLLWELNEQMEQTFIIVTHDSSIAKHANRVFVLEHGKLFAKDKNSL